MPMQSSKRQPPLSMQWLLRPQRSSKRQPPLSMQTAQARCREASVDPLGRQVATALGRWRPFTRRVSTLAGAGLASGIIMLQTAGPRFAKRTWPSLVVLARNSPLGAAVAFGWHRHRSGGRRCEGAARRHQPASLAAQIGGGHVGPRQVDQSLVWQDDCATPLLCFGCVML